VDTPTLLDILQLEQIEQDIYRSRLVLAEDYSLYGGQVAAQALLAAGLTVAAGRLPHSLHGYFLRAGDPGLPTVYQVFRDRDGGSFTARRAVAIQRGEVIFNMSASFHRPEDSPVAQAEQMPEAGTPEEAKPFGFPRLFSFEGRMPPQPFDGVSWPTRFWARATVPLPRDEMLQVCALTYLSDISTGVLPSADGGTLPGASLDHAVWFHGPADLNDWTLTEFHPRMAGQGRGWYTGSVFTLDGRLVASIAQETLFRAPRAPRPPWGSRANPATAG
jgi:acyl-CoA thioesterase II